MPRPVKTAGPITTRVGTNIRRLRTRQGMTQPELAAQLGVQGWDINYAAISRMESGRQLLHVDVVWAIGRALGATPNELFLGRK